MTGVEKLCRIQSILTKSDLFRTYKDEEEIVELRKDIKVSDFFKWLSSSGDDMCKEEKLLKLMGADDGNCTARWNTKLEAAIENGYVKRQTVKSYGRYTKWISLTSKGRKLIGI